jgi:hypothetical protein
MFVTGGGLLAGIFQMSKVSVRCVIGGEVKIYIATTYTLSVMNPLWVVGRGNGSVFFKFRSTYSRNTETTKRTELEEKILEDFRRRRNVVFTERNQNY